MVGLAFGMIILGAAVATFSLCLGMFVCTRFKKLSFRTGYRDKSILVIKITIYMYLCK